MDDYLCLARIKWKWQTTNDRRAVRFKAHRTEANLLTEGRQEKDTRVMRTELSLAAWGRRSDE